ncbi:hypothetical protein YC2023_023995 [Brassica napus]|uniref:(rape) hypothetical protein n=1 Tax=Brassica napus TaxID=3708 RepID=A0A816X4I2_BRANA|nr:unnamed protein product [Brassica napus]
MLTSSPHVMIIPPPPLPHFDAVYLYPSPLCVPCNNDSPLCSGLQRQVPPDVESLIYHRSLVSNLRTTGATYLSAKPYIGILNLNSGISGLLVTVTEFLNS